MRTPNFNIVFSVGISAILGFYAWQMINNYRSLYQHSHSIRGKEFLTFQVESGIDVNGHPVYALPPSKAQRTIVFLIRGTNVDADLNFWRQVQALRPNQSSLRLVGYCDGEVCAKAVSHASRPSDFPVIAYGELISTEAVVDQDLDGKAVLRDEGWLQPKQIEWRHQTPLLVLQEALS